MTQLKIRHGTNMGNVVSNIIIIIIFISDSNNVNHKK